MIASQFTSRKESHVGWDHITIHIWSGITSQFTSHQGRSHSTRHTSAVWAPRPRSARLIWTIAIGGWMTAAQPPSAGAQPFLHNPIICCLKYFSEYSDIFLIHTKHLDDSHRWLHTAAVHSHLHCSTFFAQPLNFNSNIAKASKTMLRPTKSPNFSRRWVNNHPTCYRYFCSLHVAPLCNL